MFIKSLGYRSATKEGSTYFRPLYIFLGAASRFDALEKCVKSCLADWTLAQPWTENEASQAELDSPPCPWIENFVWEFGIHHHSRRKHLHFPRSIRQSVNFP